MVIETLKTIVVAANRNFSGFIAEFYPALRTMYPVSRENERINFFYNLPSICREFESVAKYLFLFLSKNN